MNQHGDPSKGDSTYVFLDENVYYFNPDTLRLLKIPSMNDFIPNLK